MSNILIEALETNIKATQEKLSAQLEAAMAKHAEDITLHGKARDEVKAELQELSKRFESTVTELAQKMEGYKASGADVDSSAGAELVKSEDFKQLASGQRDKIRIEVKNTVTSGSTTVFPMQRPGIIAGDFKPLTIRQVLRTIPVSSNMVNSLRELSWTNDAAEVSQGAAKPESDITFEQYNVPITTVAHWLKISNQLLQDAPAVTAYINTRLRDGLAQRIDAQLLNGNGTSPNLSGLTDTGNFTAYTPTSDDLLVDAINRVKYTMWARGRAPDTVIVNPADWGAMERTREGVGTGAYLYGMPGAMAGMNPFGLNIVLSSNMTQGSFIVAALASSAVLFERAGAVIEMGFVNDDFTKNLITIRAEERLGLGVDAPSGITYGAFTA